MSIFLGHRHRHLGHQDTGRQRAGKNSRPRHGRISDLSPQATVERTRSGRLVAGHRQDSAVRDEAGQAQGGRRQSHRPVGADARLGIPRQAQPRHPQGPAVERPAHGRRMPGDRAAGRRPGRTDPHGGQSGADRFHGSQNPLAAQPRAQEFRQNRQGAAPQGRNPPPADRQLRLGSQRCQRHAAVGRGRAPLVERTAVEVGTRPQSAGRLVRVGRGDRQFDSRGGRACSACRPIASWSAGPETTPPEPWATASSRPAPSGPRSARRA